MKESTMDDTSKKHEAKSGYYATLSKDPPILMADHTSFTHQFKILHKPTLRIVRDKSDSK